MDGCEFEAALWSLDFDAVAQNDLSLVQGQLSFESAHEPVLELPFGTLLEQSSVNGFECYGSEPLACEEAYGFSRDNHFFALKNPTVYGLSVQYPGYAKQSLRADWAIRADKPIRANPAVRSLTIELEGLREWAGARVGKVRHSFPRESQTNWNRPTFSFVYRSDDAKDYCLFEDEKICIKTQCTAVEHGGPFSAYDFSFSENRRLLIEFKGALPDLENAIDKAVIPVWNFLSFCMGWRPEIHSIDFTSDDARATLYLPFITGRQTTASLVTHMPLSFSFLGEGRCQACMNSWFSFEGYGKEAAKSVVAFPGSWEAPLGLLFLFSANAFEAASRVGAKETELSDDEFQRRLAVLLDPVQERKIKKWAERKLRNANYVEADELARGLLKKLGAFADFVVPDQGKFCGELRTVRNRHTHLRDLDDPELPRDKELYVLLGAVKTLTYGAVMMQLGLDSGEVLERFRKSNYLSEDVAAARRRYSSACE